jgi:hypothetical protein
MVLLMAVVMEYYWDNWSADWTADDWVDWRAAATVCEMVGYLVAA